MINRLNKIADRNFVAGLAAFVLAVFIVGGFVGIKAMHNHDKAAACEAQGGTSYGRDNWLCAK